MHVAICSDGVFPESIGGIERHTRLLIESLSAARPELRITLIHTHPGRRLFAALPNVEERAVAPKPGRRQYLLECIALSRRFASELRTIPDAIIYSQGICVFSGIREFSDRLVVNPHGLESFQATGLRTRLATTPFRIAQRQTFRHARFVVALGGRLTTILGREAGPQKVVVIPNGVVLPPNRTPREARNDRPLRALFVGRLAPNKGVADLIEAMRMLVRAGLGNRLRLDVAGIGPLYEQLRLGCNLPGVRFLGKVTDEELEALYAQADVFVLPTLFEGMPTVVLEAMARGLPVLVTDVGATTELVDDSNGRIIGRSDPADLASSLRWMLELGPEQLREMGEAGLRKVVERFTWAQVAERHHALFERVR